MAQGKAAKDGTGTSRIATTWSYVLLGFTGLAMTGFLAAGVQYLPVTFFSSQDLPVAVSLVVMLILARSMPHRLLPIRPLARLYPRMTAIPAWLVAASVALVALFGAFSVLGTYPLSMDEYWARADGSIFVSGRLMAEIPRQWHGFAEAMFPIFARLGADGSVAGSSYLPVNATFQGVMGPLASPLFAGGAVLCLAYLARTHLPNGKSAAVPVCVILGASSAQCAVTGSTTYSMTAHLFFNLLWLCLVFIPGRARQAGGALVAFIAMGLHQFAFFPIFAGFFVIELFLSERRTAATVQAGAILLAAVFWISWPGLSMELAGGGGPASSGDASPRLVDQIISLVLANDPLATLSVMGFNLVRLQLWTNPLLVPLVAVAIPIAWSEKGIFRAAMLSCLATIGFMALVMPYQGHGWGYRYLHQQLGSMCLLAGLAWQRLHMGSSEGGKALFAAATLVSLALVPVRYWQAIEFAQPYARADAQISASEADVVVVDAPSHMFAIDLVRNVPRDPSRPVRLAADALSDVQFRELCQAYSVEVFDGADAERAGIPSFDQNTTLEDEKTRTRNDDKCAYRNISGSRHRRE